MGTQPIQHIAEQTQQFYLHIFLCVPGSGRGSWRLVTGVEKALDYT